MFKKLLTNERFYTHTYPYMMMLITIAIVAFMGYNYDMDIITAISILGNSLGVFLVSAGSILNFPICLIGIVAYAYQSLGVGLNGEFFLNIFYIVTGFIGWWMWYKSSKNSESNHIKFKAMSNKLKIITSVISILAIAGFGTLLSNIEEGDILFGITFHKSLMPYMDATSNILGIVSMILLMFQYREQWYGWILLNIINMYLWANTLDILMCVLWVILLVNSVIGMLIWHYNSKK